MLLTTTSERQGRVIDHDSADITVKAIGYMDRSFCGALVGIDWVKVDGSPGSDSYDSVEGPYDPATANPKARDGNSHRDARAPGKTTSNGIGPKGI